MAHLTKEERLNYTKLFLELDDNGDGYLDKRELGHLCVSLGYRLTPSRLTALFNNIDTDGNGKITLDEFLNTMPSVPPVERETARLRKIFNDLDTDGDGVLTVEELSRGIRCGGLPMPKREIERLIRQVDKNGDGQLDYEEFIALAAKMQTKR